MKTTVKALFMLALAGGLVSCEGLKNLADVKFDTELSADLNIAVDQPEVKAALDGYSYSAEATLDPTSDPEVEKYVEKIKSYEITSLTATVTQVSASDVKLLQGSWFKVADASGSAEWVLQEDFDVTVGNSLTLGNEDGQWTSVQEILGRNAEFTVSTQGSANQNNITLTLEISIGATVTANPL